MTASLTHTKTFEGKRMSGVLDEFELQLQVALLCCHALESKDFTSVLSSAANLHNLSVEYARCKPAGSGERVKYTVFFTSDAARAVGVGSTASNASILQPTAYVVFTQPHPPKDSWLSDFACSCVQTHDCHMQMNVAELADSVSLNPFLTLVGQGMRVVVTGTRLAGAVAHAVAARLLLTLHRDLAAALAQGITLSESFLRPKVTSYGFGAPFFACNSLQRTLEQAGLHRQLHTIWAEGDAAMPFFMLSSQLLTAVAAVAAAADAAAEAAVAAAKKAKKKPAKQASSVQHSASSTSSTGADGASNTGTSGASPDNALSGREPLPLMESEMDGSASGKCRFLHMGVCMALEASPESTACKDHLSRMAVLQSPELAAIQNWCSALADGIAKNTQRKAAIASMLTQQVDVQGMAKAVEDALAAAAAAAAAAAGSGKVSKSGSLKASASAAGSAAGASAGPASPSVSRPTPGATASTPASAASSKKALGSSSGSKGGSAEKASAEPATPPKSSWKSALQEMLSLGASLRPDCMPQYTGVGCFWLLRPPPANKPAPGPAFAGSMADMDGEPLLESADSASLMQAPPHAASLVRMQTQRGSVSSLALFQPVAQASLLPIDSVQAAIYGPRALHPDNPRLLQAWEYCAEEYKRDLNEAVGFMTFSTQGRGAAAAMKEAPHRLRWQ